MHNPLSNRLHDGTRTQDAMDMFKAIISMNKMDKFTIQGWGKDIVLPYLIDPEGWLATWMLKSDEICIALFGCRIWNVVYQADKDCVEGVRPINMSEIVPDKKNLDSYLSYSLAEDNKIPFSMRFLLCKHAFFGTLDISGTEVNIKPIRGIYNKGNPLESGDLLPLLNENDVYAHFLSKLTFKMNKELIIDKINSINFDNEHAMGVKQ